MPPSLSTTLLFTRPPAAGQIPEGWTEVGQLPQFEGADRRVDFKAYYNESLNTIIVTGVNDTIKVPDGNGGTRDANILFDGGFTTTFGVVTQQPLAVSQATQIITELAARYPTATIQATGEGSVGYVMAAATYGLRQDADPSLVSQLGTTVTFNGVQGYAAAGSDPNTIDFRVQGHRGPTFFDMMGDRAPATSNQVMVDLSGDPTIQALTPLAIAYGVGKTFSYAL